MDEAVHTGVVTMFLLVSSICLVFTYIGIDTYIESGRSVYGDARTSVGYQWKSRSCGEVFRVLFPTPPSSLPGTRMSEVCAIARSSGVPPVCLRSIVDEVRLSFADTFADGGERREVPDRALVLLGETRATLVRRLSELEGRYRRQAREVSCMWLFFPGVIGFIAAYFYARRFTPAMFDRAKTRFSSIMFGRNRYSDAFDSFVGKKRK